MKRFKNILFVDGSPKSNRALRRAVDLARRNDSLLKVIKVIEDIPRGIRGRGKSDYPLDLLIIKAIIVYGLGVGICYQINSTLELFYINQFYEERKKLTGTNIAYKVFKARIWWVWILLMFFVIFEILVIFTVFV